MKNYKTAHNSMEYKRIRGLTKRTYVEGKKSWDHHKRSMSIKKYIRHTCKKNNKLWRKFTPTIRVNTNAMLTSEPKEVADIFTNHLQGYI